MDRKATTDTRDKLFFCFYLHIETKTGCCLAKCVSSFVKYFHFQRTGGISQTGKTQNEEFHKHITEVPTGTGVDFWLIGIHTHTVAVCKQSVSGKRRKWNKPGI